MRGRRPPEYGRLWYRPRSLGLPTADLGNPAAGAPGTHTFAILRVGGNYVVVVHPRTSTFDGSCLYIAPARTLRFGRPYYQGWL